MLKIGEFSKLGQVSPKALRLYADRGLLPPAWIDRFSGYRYYEARQLARLHRILALKDLGFSLDEIGELLDGGLDAEALGDLMRARQQAITRQIAAEKARLRRIEARLQQLELSGAAPAYEVVLKPSPAMVVAGLRRELPDQAALPVLMSELHQALGGAPDVPVLALYYDRAYRVRNFDVEVAVPASGGSAPAGLRRHELPAEPALACTVHRGDAGALAMAYEAVFRWLDSSGYRACGPNRELYLQWPGRDGELLAEVQVPVETKPFLSTVAKPEETKTMSIEIQNRPAFSAVGIPYFGRNQQGEIPELWEVVSRRVAEIKGRTGEAFGLCRPVEADGRFHYLAAFGVDPDAEAPLGMEKWDVPAQTYAVFPCTLQTIHDTYQYAFDTWGPQSGYTFTEGIDFELYTADFDPGTGEENLFICIPVIGEQRAVGGKQ